MGRPQQCRRLPGRPRTWPTKVARGHRWTLTASPAWATHRYGNWPRCWASSPITTGIPPSILRCRSRNDGGGPVRATNGQDPVARAMGTPTGGRTPWKSSLRLADAKHLSVGADPQRHSSDHWVSSFVTASADRAVKSRQLKVDLRKPIARHPRRCWQMRSPRM